MLDGQVVDERVFCSDYINLAHNAGVYLFREFGLLFPHLCRDDLTKQNKPGETDKQRLGALKLQQPQREEHEQE